MKECVFHCLLGLVAVICWAAVTYDLSWARLVISLYWLVLVLKYVVCMPKGGKQG